MQTYDGADHGRDQGQDVAVAVNGSIYVTGSTDVAGQGGNLLLQKYAPDGTLLWTRTHNGVDNGHDQGRGVAVAADDSIYVTGSENILGQDQNMLLQKYTPDGDLLWTKTYNGVSNGFDSGAGVAVAGSRFVYVAGTTEVAGQDRNLFLSKYAANGDLLWMKTYNGVNNRADIGAGVAVAAGRVYVTGTIEINGQDDDMLLQKYSSNGALLWTKTYNGPDNDPDSNWDDGYAVAAAPDGGVYVTGASGPGAGNLLLWKYAPNGRLVRKKRLEGTATLGHGGRDVVVAPNGSVFVTGYTEVDGQGPNMLLRKYTPNGRLAWTQTYNGIDNGGEVGEGVARARNGSIYVTGRTDVTGQDSNLLLIKYK